MNEKGYNGWSNYETWNVKLWIDNEEVSYEHWRERAEECRDDADGDLDAARQSLADELESHYDEFAPTTRGVYADLLNHALGRVDWHEIAANMLDELDPVEPEEGDDAEPAAEVAP